MSRRIAIIATALCMSAACDRPAHQPDPHTASEAAVTDAVGETSREWIVERHPTWAPSNAAEPDEKVASALSRVPPGASIDVYLGTWCGDSRREVPRFWRALDVAGDVPFEVRHVGLDRNFEAGDVDLSSADVIAVPTFVVRRDGAEVGRVVEQSPGGIEHDIHALLVGERSGQISATR